VGRDRVMDAALQLFLQRGYRGTSMKALATQVGVSAPAIYWYFASKDELYVSVIEKAMHNFVTYVRTSMSASDPRDRLAQLVRAHVTWQLQQSDVAKTFDLTVSVNTVTHDISIEKLEYVKSMQLEYVQVLREVLTEGQAQGVMRPSDVSSTAFAVVTLCEYVHTWFKPEGRLTVDDVAGTYESMIRNMVEARP
jgi:AcrR family transcriptional regulator